MTTLDWIRIFLQFVVMVWTLQRVQLSLSYEHQHVSDKKGIQPGSSNIETDPCFTSLFSPWYAPRIRARWRLCQVPIFSCLHILSQTQPHFRLPALFVADFISITFGLLLIKTKTHRGFHFITGISEIILYFACKSCLARTPLVGRCP